MCRERRSARGHETDNMACIRFCHIAVGERRRGRRRAYARPSRPLNLRAPATLRDARRSRGFTGIAHRARGSGSGRRWASRRRVPARTRPEWPRGARAAPPTGRFAPRAAPKSPHCRGGAIFFSPRDYRAWIIDSARERRTIACVHVARAALRSWRSNTSSATLPRESLSKWPTRIAGESFGLPKPYLIDWCTRLTCSSHMAQIRK